MNDALRDRIEEAKGREADHQPEKRIFILLLLLTCGALIVLAVALWLIPYIGFTNIHPSLPLIKLDEGMRREIRATLGKPENERRRLELELGRGADRRWVELEIRDDPREAGGRIFYLYDTTDVHTLRQQLAGQRSGRMVGDSAAMR